MLEPLTKARNAITQLIGCHALTFVGGVRSQQYRTQCVLLVHWPPIVDRRRSRNPALPADGFNVRELGTASSGAPERKNILGLWIVEPNPLTRTK